MKMPRKNENKKKGNTNNKSKDINSKTKEIHQEFDRFEEEMNKEKMETENENGSKNKVVVKRKKNNEMNESNITSDNNKNNIISKNKNNNDNNNYNTGNINNEENNVNKNNHVNKNNLLNDNYNNNNNISRMNSNILNGHYLHDHLDDLISKDGEEIDKKLTQILYDHHKQDQLNEIEQTKLELANFVEEAYNSMYFQINEALQLFAQNLENKKKEDLLKNLFLSEKSKCHNLKLENEELEKEHAKISNLLEEAQLENRDLEQQIKHKSSLNNTLNEKLDNENKDNSVNSIPKEGHSTIIIKNLKEQVEQLSEKVKILESKLHKEKETNKELSNTFISHQQILDQLLQQKKNGGDYSLDLGSQKNGHSSRSDSKKLVKLQQKIQFLESACQEKDFLISKLKKKSKKILEYNQHLEDSRVQFEHRNSQILNAVERMNDDLYSEKQKIFLDPSFSMERSLRTSFLMDLSHKKN
eukprot:TRINITY_DN1195_c0_g1_i1.p1 TRINITY_DN1195_c0_g1~~TRINITY_DN1195_c0_g1_i1.p1  ORF type:complete len:471 (-),score=154.60 TRINITY_DN1195_c0_g1_i1:82-1494(-)